MRSCHNAATEFLRQYWSALLPLPAGSLGGSTPNTVPKGKEARDPVKAEKMANYLRSTEKKIEAVVRTAQQSGVDPARVKAVSALVDVLCDTDHIGTSTHSGCGECGAVTRIYPSRCALVMGSDVVPFSHAHRPCVEGLQCVRHKIASWRCRSDRKAPVKLYPVYFWQEATAGVGWRSKRIQRLLACAEESMDWQSMWLSMNVPEVIVSETRGVLQWHPVQTLKLISSDTAFKGWSRGPHTIRANREANVESDQTLLLLHVISSPFPTTHSPTDHCTGSIIQHAYLDHSTDPPPSNCHCEFGPRLTLGSFWLRAHRHPRRFCM